MSIQRRTLLAGAAAAPLLTPLRARAQAKPIVRVGVMNDMSGPYRDVNGPTGVACTRQAVQEFQSGAFDVEVLSADHQNKPDVAISLAREWFDNRGVDIVIDIAATSCALALAGIVKEKNKIMIATSTASSDVTGKACTPNSMHWAFDTYMEARSTGGAMVKAGGDTWYFITPNYAFGEATQRDTTNFVLAGGGKVLGAQIYPFPETTDFSSFLVKAQASGAKILGICGAGSDLINIVKQAHEFGLTQTMNLAAMVAYTTDMHSIGIEMAQGTRLSETYYWDLNERTRSFQKRIQPKVTLWPNMAQAADYSCTLHYLKAVADMGPKAAQADGAATVARMKAMPTDDDCFGVGKIREDGRKIHPAYLFEVKKPSESRHEWDLYKQIGVTPAEEAFRPLSDNACPLVKA
ncbi:ABC transporter substrate-binding protein [Rhodopila sp.]|jgi:branched-chain amino acid transport system substrate-binding protein|uniref:ABC transporter substrate-binding protein n=1 Tax=Rhodopila sp. TaxID=2480087 RepID=UPI002C5948F1|nr:ABC transporter substrate-binding protein [Rhodopila sp.]HVZ08343.1 ABC transporter substrate-binding protein [Rhodopila sp.]